MLAMVFHAPSAAARSTRAQELHDVHRVHRVEHQLRHRLTPFHGRVDWQHHRLWARRRRHWNARFLMPRLVIPAVFVEDPDTAVRVAQCESGLRPSARNPDSTATGLFQILGGPTGVWSNVLLAHRMYHDRGWEPWTASEACWR